MNINDTFRYLHMGIPERIRQKKDHGDFAGAIEDIDQILMSEDLPFAMRQCLTAEREMIRRFPEDFPYSKEEAIALVQKSIPDFAEEEFDQWEKDFRIRWIYANGEKRYFDRFFESLCKTDAEIAGRAGCDTVPRNEKYFKEAAEIMRKEGSAEKRFHCRSSAQLKEEVFVPGKKVSAVLPVPCACDSQSEIRIEKISPKPTHISPEDAHQRIVFWEENMQENHEFSVEFSYIRKAVYHDLWNTKLQIDKNQDLNETEARYLEEYAPHILFAPYIRELADKLTKDKENALEKARAIYDFVTGKVKYSFMPAYFSQESIAENCARNLTGDCGVQTLLFITLCRCAGVPAKWESGWAAEPGFCGAHDWSRFYIKEYGWLYADVSYGGDAAARGDEARRRFYFGNLDPYRMSANTEFQADFDVARDGWRADPYDNQVGEMEIEGRGLEYSDFLRKKEVLDIK